MPVVNTYAHAVLTQANVMGDFPESARIGYALSCSINQICRDYINLVHSILYKILDLSSIRDQIFWLVC